MVILSMTDMSNPFLRKHYQSLDLLDSGVIVFCAFFLIYVFFRVRSQRKKNLEVVTLVDVNKVDVLMQPKK